MPNSAIGNDYCPQSSRRLWPILRRSAAEHQCELSARFGRPLHAGEPSVVIVMRVDEACSAMTAWASKLMDHPAYLGVDDIVQHDHLRMLERCDVALICSANEEKLLNLIKACRRSAPHAAIFAVVDELPPSQRAGLFGVGAEDILSPSMDVQEGAARIRGICQRLAARR